MIRLLLLIVGATYFSIAHAQTSGPSLSRCQCNYDKWVGVCVATISKQSDWVRITSNTQQCSRVDWYIEGAPQMTIVTNGVETESLLNVKPGAKLVIQSCNICQDAMLPEGSSPSAGGTAPMQPTAVAISPFAGTWTGAERNLFGFGHTSTVKFIVQGDTISGSWVSDNGSSDITGTVEGSSATVSFPGPGIKGLRLDLVNPTTIKYSSVFFSGTLTKSP